MLADPAVIEPVDAMTRLAVALAVGLLLGLERESSHADAERQSLGSRTFALLGLSGGVGAAVGPAVAAGGAVAVGLLITASYRRTSRKDIGATTEAAALAAYLLGVLAWTYQLPAVAAGVVAVGLLASKERLHHFTHDVVTEDEVADAIKFFVLAFVVLPLLPDRGMGPYAALNPSRIWFFVVAITGIGWVGYIATRALGAHRGLPIVGFAGGFVSGSATTGMMGRQAKLAPHLLRPALAGAMLASVATFVQLSLITAVASHALLVRLAPAMLVSGLVLTLQAVLLAHSASTTDDPRAGDHPRAFSLTPALVLAGLLTGVLLLSRWAAEQYGAAGTVAATSAAGLADVHAAVLTVALSLAGGNVALGTAVLASGLALATNTLVKVVLATAAGGLGFGLRFAALLVLPVTTFILTLGVT